MTSDKINNSGGVSTSRGINFQYAYSLSMLLDFISHPEWHSITLEGQVDIEDATIKDSYGHVLVRSQIKQKTGLKAWVPSELRDVLLAFAKVASNEGSDYEFIYSGAEGQDFQRVKKVLNELSHGGSSSLSEDDMAKLRTLSAGN